MSSESFVVLTLAVVAVARSRPGLQPAMAAARHRLGRRVLPERLLPPGVLAMAGVREPGRTGAQALPWARLDGWRRLGYRPVEPAVTGPGVAISPLRRLRSALALLALLVVLGIVLAALIGLAVLVAGALFEQAIS